MSNNPEHGGSSNLSPERAFGQVLRSLRRARSLTQEELAHLSGYHANYIGYLERGIKSPSLRGIINLAAVLEVSASLMMRRVEALITNRGNKQQRSQRGR
jgi:transcriptional regulator with XRE-family HTH domain